MATRFKSKSRPRLPAAPAGNEAEEGEDALAGMIDHALVFVSLADRRVADELSLCNGSSMARVLADRTAANLPATPTDAEMPPGRWRSAYLMGPDGDDRAGAEYRTETVRQLGLAERTRLSAFGAIPAGATDACELRRLDIAASGAAAAAKSLVYYRTAGSPLWGSNGESYGQPQTRRHFSGTRWRESERITASDSSLAPTFGRHFAWVRHNYWHVSLSMPGSCRLLLATDATGVKGFFRLRDVPEGRGRRAALLHWVQAHWRKNRKDDDRHEVQEHRRGATEFDWFGLRGAVHVPAKLEENGGGA